MLTVQLYKHIKRYKHVCMHVQNTQNCMGPLHITSILQIKMSAYDLNGTVWQYLFNKKDHWRRITTSGNGMLVLRFV